MTKHSCHPSWLVSVERQHCVKLMSKGERRRMIPDPVEDVPWLASEERHRCISRMPPGERRHADGKSRRLH